MSDSPLLTSDGKKHLKPDPQAKNCRPHRPASSSGRPFGEKRRCKCGTGLRADNPQAPRNGRRPCRRLRPAQPHNRVTAHCKALHATQPHTAQPRKNSKNSKSSKSSKPRRHPPAPTAPPPAITHTASDRTSARPRRTFRISPKHTTVLSANGCPCGMKDGKDMKGAERRKPEAVLRRPPSEKPRTACDTVFSVPQAAPDSRASLISVRKPPSP